MLIQIMKIKISNIKNFFRKVTKFGLYIPLSNVVLTYGQGKLPKSLIQKTFNTRNNKIQKCLKPIIDSVNKADYAVTKPNQEVKDAVWVCWFQGEAAMPPIVRKCYESIKSHSGNHPVVLITVDNFNEYVKIPETILKKYEAGELSLNHLSDIIRANLLAQQGGLWLDATILLTEDLKDGIFDAPVYTAKIPEFGYFVSRCSWAGFALHTTKGHPLAVKLAKAFELYFENHEVVLDYFLIDQFIDMLYKSDSEIKKAIDAVPYNNLQIHGLDSRLEDKYDAEKLKQLKSDTGIFKLSWKFHDDKRLEDPNSMFSML